MKSYINMSPDYQPGLSGSSQSSSKSSVTSGSICRSVRSFSEQIGPFILFKVCCCFFISLANFTFNEKFGKLVASSLNNGSRNLLVYETAQNYLFTLEISCWIIPLVAYLLWSRSKLITIGLNAMLFTCSAFSFLVGIGLSFSGGTSDSSKTLIIILWLTRFIYCFVLSLAYWINLFDLLILFSAKHLLPIGIYFTTTVVAALFSNLLENQTFQLAYFLFGFFFLVLTFTNRHKRKKETRLVRCIDGEDFPLMSVAFRGIRTSLAYFELAMMTGIVVLNSSCFLAAVDLRKYNRNLLKNPTQSSTVLSFLSIKSGNHSDFSYCSVGLLIGFIVMVLISLIKFKKIFLSYVAKLLLVIYNLNFLFCSKSSQTDVHLFEMMLFFALAVNFCVKLNDIIRGFKRFLNLCDIDIRLDFLYLKAFDLLVVSLFTGFVFGGFAIMILCISQPDNIQQKQLKAFAELVFLFIIGLCSFESFDNDGFLIIREPPEEDQPEFTVNGMEPLGQIDGGDQSVPVNPNAANLPSQANQMQFRRGADRAKSNAAFDQRLGNNENSLRRNSNRFKNEKSNAFNLDGSSAPFSDSGWNSFGSAMAPSAPCAPSAPSAASARNTGNFASGNFASNNFASSNFASGNFASGSTMFSGNRDCTDFASSNVGSRGDNYTTSAIGGMFSGKQMQKSGGGSESAVREGGQRSGRRNKNRERPNQEESSAQQPRFPPADDDWGND